MPLTKEDVLLAQQGLKTLQARLKRSPNTRRARLLIEAGTTTEIALPPQAVQALAEALGHLAAGQDVTVTALPHEMTTQQAADVCRVIPDTEVLRDDPGHSGGSPQFVG